MDPRWLDWAQRLQIIAQNGLHYAQDLYDRDRYEQVRDIAAGLMAGPAEAGVDPAQVRAMFTADTGHATPKVDVRGVIFREDRVLLVRELADAGRWTVPGGWADPGESPAESTVREVYEESGYHTRAVKLLALYDRNRHGHPPHPYHIYKIFFLCELVDPPPVPASRAGHEAAFHETEGADFFPIDKLPPLSIGRVTAKQIARFHEHFHHPELPTDFD